MDDQADAMSTLRRWAKDQNRLLLFAPGVSTDSPRYPTPTYYTDVRVKTVRPDGTGIQLAFDPPANPLSIELGSSMPQVLPTEDKPYPELPSNRFEKLVQVLDGEGKIYLLGACRDESPIQIG
jgi:hypothetical protein